ncbi:MAG: hypothetical protein ACLP22_15005 [Solirubrobacteraceae bacterium]
MPIALVVRGRRSPGQRRDVEGRGHELSLLDVLVSTDPSGAADTWKSTAVGGDLAGISCASTRLCVAIEKSGVVIDGTHAG